MADEFLPPRDEPLAPEPPPVPAAHPAGRRRISEGVRLALSFYAEICVGFAALLPLGLLLRWLTPLFVSVAFSLSLLLLFLICLSRLVRRALAARKKGRPPWQATVAFWLVFALPLGGAGCWAWRERANEDPLAPAREEAKAKLAAARRAEEDFHRSYGHYTYSINELNLSPESGARYALGFPEACTVRFSVPGAPASWDLYDMGFSSSGRLAAKEFFLAARKAPDCRDPAKGFEVFAVGETKPGAPLDRWRIDESGKTEQILDGLKP